MNGSETMLNGSQTMLNRGGSMLNGSGSMLNCDETMLNGSQLSNQFAAPARGVRGFSPGNSSRVGVTTLPDRGWWGSDMARGRRKRVGLVPFGDRRSVIHGPAWRLRATRVSPGVTPPAEFASATGSGRHARPWHHSLTPVHGLPSLKYVPLFHFPASGLHRASLLD